VMLFLNILLEKQALGLARAIGDKLLILDE
jgi:hypothetical protein